MLVLVIRVSLTPLMGVLVRSFRLTLLMPLQFREEFLFGYIHVASFSD